MTTFDEVLPKTVRVVESSALAPYLTESTLIRDLRGRVRLVLTFRQRVGADGNPTDDLPPGWPNERDALRSALALGLGHYWGNQIWRQNDRKDAAFVALRDTIKEKRKPFAPASSTLPALNWYKLDRQLSKSTWMHGAAPPWPADDPGAPSIVAFYSFKGGVGRTVAVAAVAMLLAHAGKKVVALDLDLEAPGLGPLLLGATTSKEEGIVDYLIEREAAGRRPRTLSPYVDIQSNPTLVDSEPIRVLSAGRVNMSFLEKIARLDFDRLVASEKSPIGDLLDHVRTEIKPDFILLDVRSGLHDLGGLSLNGLSHLDVLFGREEPEAWAGLAVVLELIGAATPRRDVFVVHAQVPPERIDPGAHQRFLTESYKLFETHYYDAGDQMDDIADKEAPYGLEIAFTESLQGSKDLVKLAPALLGKDGDYYKLARKIGAFLERETVK